MANKSKKISELLAVTGASTGDLMVIVDDAGTTDATTKKITVDNLFGNISVRVATSANITMTGNVFLTANQLMIKRTFTPNTDSFTIGQGSLFYDNNYIYIAPLTDTVKRVKIKSFSEAEETQNVFTRFVGNTGSVNAAATNHIINIYGSNGISTAVSGNTITISLTSLTVSGPYANNTAAAAANVAVGALYYTAAGDVKIRLS